MKNIDLLGSQVLITGGAGFIGSNLTERLVNLGAKVTIIDMMLPPYGGNKFNLQNIKKKIVFIKKDIREEIIMRKLVKGKDFIFHLAGQTGRIISMENPVLDSSINCLGTLSLLEALKKENRKAKLIFAGSRGVIGKPMYLPVDENHPTNPLDIYGVNKLTAENYCFVYGREYRFPVCSLRFNNVYGPKCQIKSNHYGTINLFIAYALQKKTLPVYGNGCQTRDYLYIDDAVDALIRATETKADGHFFFVCSGKGYSLLKIVQLIKKEIKTTKYKLTPYPKELKTIDFPNFVSSFDKIKKVLSWEPKVSLDHGIKTTIEYYQRNLLHYL